MFHLSVQLVSAIDVDRGMVVVEAQGDGQGHGGLGGGQHDDEDGDELAVEPQTRLLPTSCGLPKATKFTFAPLSTSSMPISTPTAFRLIVMQTTPQTNRTARRSDSATGRSIV